ncbi:RNA-guided endonuclease InsQ/TnpB family protein [Nitrosococcus watsonii]|uniref:Transposase, IS605 OrfB family n=1 Tax=Nitrosococcus watsoni (strain C-113) TaxID=105559 RepID=D8KBI6_NITWC|nr:RNA-guided endonuclease TnpB family protein [Nitrosococcus watsonii]ADJ29633.1 transposase, IS605 OrfB family [Nitrosococcus watsonii C-113]
MIKAFKYRLYPNAHQARELEIALETHRRLYNARLEQRKAAYELEKKSVKYAEQSSWFKHERSTNPYFARLNFSSAQATMRRLDKAFQAFFRRIKAGEKPGYPRFKARGRFDSWTYPAHGDGARLLHDQLRFQHVGLVKVRQHRPVEGAVKIVQVKNEAGRWFVIASCDIGDGPAPRAEDTSVGLDVGLEYFLSTDQGERVNNPRYQKEALRRLRIAGRAVSRKRKGGRNRAKAVARLRAIQARVANKRRDHHHKVARDLVSRYAFIAAESLTVRNRVRNRRLSRSISDAGWRQFLNILRAKAESAGSVLVEVPPQGISQACSGCGAVVRKALSVRTHKCPACSLRLQRDVNAARNILARGQARLESVRLNVAQ